MEWRDSAWFANACDRESEHGSFSPEFGRNGNKWSAIKSKHGLPSKESLHGSKCGENNSDCATNWKTTTPYDGDEAYNMKNSPTLEDRRQQNCHHSLKSDRSSVLTEAGVGAEVEVVVEAQFMALGGNRDSLRRPETDLACQLKYVKKLWLGDAGEAVSVIFFTKIFKAMRMVGIIGKRELVYSHDGVSDGFNKGSINEISRERENNKRNKLTSPEQDVERGARKSSSISCRYFSTGNCHNGNYCRFSHPASTECHKGQWGRSSVSSDSLLDGAELTDIDASFNVDKYGNASNGSDADVSNESEIPWTGPKWSAADASIDLHNSWAGSEQSDTSVYLGASKLNKDANGFSNCNMDERWQHGYEACGKNSESNVHCKRIDIDREDLKKIENVGVNTGVSKPKGAEESIVAMEMSLMWNCRIHASVDKEKSHSSEPTSVGTSLRAHGKNIIEKASGHAHDEHAASQLMSKEESNFHLDHMTRGSSCTVLRSFDHLGPSSSYLPYSNLNTIRQSELSFLSNEVNIKVPQNNLLLQEEKPSNKLNIGDTNILHGNYGFPSTQNIVTSFANSRRPVESGQEITFPEQYNPRSDSIDPAKKQDTNTEPLGFSVHPVSQESTADGKLELLGKNFLPSSLVGGRNDSDYHNDHSSKRKSDFDSHKPNQLEPIASFELTKENGGIVQTKKAEAENKNGLLENTDANDRTEEGKKSKDSKGVRAFKFALVEFVKDLLKPTWKEGQICKEAYKIIVRKVVDKVTATMQGTNIPQTLEKINQYLSFLKPKLSKLVHVQLIERCPMSVFMVEADR
ncbi:zinc finger CCCH domain-containing protein 38-like [Gossypium australe]|uniref:Zinc finger CCCH domain-containing protein 38-like n=1 Tax=Gossypium australe TaxID=47621 RepID=A0A5B6WQR7_9ROSI|nr:zinc finger CCCH domain-containing protein 38-like [Gossypium australe]